jgi:hypothetical protein
MTRVSSQKVRQMLLVTGDPLDPSTLPERLQLFNELGEPLMLGGGYARHEQEETTGWLIANEIETDILEMYPSVRLYKIATNRPARVRLYPTPEQRQLDIGRSIGVKPQGNHGRLLEVVTTSTLLELILSPAVDMTSVDPFNSDFYSTVTNMDSAEGAVAVTYYYFRTE